MANYYGDVEVVVKMQAAKMKKCIRPEIHGNESPVDSRNADVEDDG